MATSLSNTPKIHMNPMYESADNVPTHISSETRRYAKLRLESVSQSRENANPLHVTACKLGQVFKQIAHGHYEIHPKLKNRVFVPLQEEDELLTSSMGDLVQQSISMQASAITREEQGIDAKEEEQTDEYVSMTSSCQLVDQTIVNGIEACNHILAVQRLHTSDVELMEEARKLRKQAQKTGILESEQKDCERAAILLEKSAEKIRIVYRFFSSSCEQIQTEVLAHLHELHTQLTKEAAHAGTYGNEQLEELFDDACDYVHEAIGLFIYAFLSDTTDVLVLQKLDSLKREEALKKTTETTEESYVSVKSLAIRKENSTELIPFSTIYEEADEGGVDFDTCPEEASPYYSTIHTKQESSRRLLLFKKKKNVFSLKKKTCNQSMSSQCKLLKGKEALLLAPKVAMKQEEEFVLGSSPEECLARFKAISGKPFAGISLQDAKILYHALVYSLVNPISFSDQEKVKLFLLFFYHSLHNRREAHVKNQLVSRAPGEEYVTSVPGQEYITFLKTGGRAEVEACYIAFFIEYPGYPYQFMTEKERREIREICMSYGLNIPDPLLRLKRGRNLYDLRQQESYGELIDWKFFFASKGNLRCWDKLDSDQRTAFVNMFFERSFPAIPIKQHGIDIAALEMQIPKTVTDVRKHYYSIQQIDWLNAMKKDLKLTKEVKQALMEKRDVLRAHKACPGGVAMIMQLNDYSGDWDKM